ncbi:MAG: YidC/Oxa1 family insertase periplasmic-domain containing protein [Anaerohalosphaeraceae bacterium]
MTIKRASLLFMVLFMTACGALIWQTITAGNSAGLIRLAAEVESQPATLPVQPAEQPAASLQNVKAELLPAEAPVEVSAISGSEQTVTLGGLSEKLVRTNDPSQYKFQVELTTLGAGVRTAWLSEFSNLDRKDPKAMAILSPVTNGKTSYSMTCESLYVAKHGQGFSGLAFPLEKLNWKLAEQSDGKAVFVAELGRVETLDGKRQMTEPKLRITRTYQVQPGSYDLISNIRIENLSAEALKVQLNVAGPTGIPHEGQQRDTLKVFAAFQSEAQVDSHLLDTAKMKKAVDKNKPDDLKFASKDSLPFLWGAITNKYFTAIAYPSTEVAKTATGFLTARYYAENPDVRHSENCSFVLKMGSFELGAAGDSNSAADAALNLYLGPKDKKVFEDNPIYNKLSFFHTIDFSSCCCPKSMIAPLAFGIVWLMNTLYHAMGPLGNYGIVIMIFVFVIRLALHPLTKSGQVQMMKMQKMQPKIQEIQKKYASNKQEMQRQMMLVYREGGVSQFMFMVPMLIQMPIWIALWTAVYMNVDLRGQGFLPFWITDLSGPDALFRFPPIDIPLVGELSSFNLLPLLMGGVMYLQMKLTPQAQTAQANPEMAQQQKIMSIMMVAMFPVFLYNGASGVNLYIMSSIAAGVIEQMVIRKHLKERQGQEEETLVPATAKLAKVKKKKPKPFFRVDK